LAASSTPSIETTLGGLGENVMFCREPLGFDTACKERRPLNQRLRLCFGQRPAKRRLSLAASSAPSIETTLGGLGENVMFCREPLGFDTA